MWSDRAVSRRKSDAIARAPKALGMKKFTAATVNGSEMSLRESTNYAVVQVNIGLESIDSGAMTINSGYKIAGMAVWGLELMNFK